MDEFFTQQNSDLTSAQREWANNRVAEILAAIPNPDENDVESARDRANNELPESVA